MELNKSFHIYGLFQLRMHTRFILLMILLFAFQLAYGQADPDPDFMRSVGKIYVVAAVTIVILISLFAYMIIIDRKISRLEKRNKNE